MADFLAAQWASLTREFPLSLATHEPSPTHFDTTRLLDLATCRHMLEALGPVMGSPARAITASLLAKRIAFLVTGPAFYAMSAFDQGLDLRLENCVTDVTHADGLWQSRLLLKTMATDCPTPEDRTRWRERVARRVFAEHLAPLWVALHKASGISPRILWENTAVRVYSLYERRIARLTDSVVRSNAEDDFRYLVHDAPADVFGIAKNPLARYFFKPRPTVSPTGQACDMRVRKTCCLYFKATQPAEYCSACPLIHPRAPLPPR